jgi:2,3-bisphosphoglycerate-independent phosphoglycerate mutase
MCEVAYQTPSKIVLLVMDGLGGLPDPDTGMTELESAHTPALDRLAKVGVCGLSNPVGPGITPGSAPGHLSLFGYDPVNCFIGRGVLEAVGIDFDLQADDVAARGNFCTVDERGTVTDRRAGRISNDKCTELSGLLNGMEIGEAQILVRPVQEHRFVVVFRGRGLDASVHDSDPQQTGVPPRDVEPLNSSAEETARIANEFVAQAKERLAAHAPANMVLLRGFSTRPQFPTMSEIYKLKPAAIASYPMYRGLARLVGMDVLHTGSSIQEEFDTLRDHYDNYDFFFVHIKGTDSAGEDGDFARKVRVIEEVDAILGSLELRPDVLVVTGDHSTPARLKSHSWHPVPVLLSSEWCRPDTAEAFGESQCLHGGLGHLEARDIMPLAMAHALKLTKYGP